MKNGNEIRFRPYQGGRIKIKDLPWQPCGRVLDPFASTAAWWEGIYFPDVIFTDIIPQMANGLIQADAMDLPFRDNSFDEIWADPPHNIEAFFIPKRFGSYGSRYRLRSLNELWAMEFARLAPTLIIKSAGDLSRNLDCYNFYWRIEDQFICNSALGWSKAKVTYTRFRHARA